VCTNIEDTFLAAVFGGGGGGGEVAVVVDAESDASEGAKQKEEFIGREDAEGDAANGEWDG